ncbi:diacylglycerol kinase family protein [Mesobacillus subterraneus]|uniref:Diacylglycerol kinase family protein n=1 Tax=Mesobacillus subterraneus TaxID=285983 RepID=A0A427TH29_9BACI|nr:diacylglycerol kinase family protein [Mesobacillus subterraneus]RSD22743.1 diacylglycerol kinase family protein [Mesobacillus subterraneus]
MALEGNKRRKHTLASSFKFGFQGIASAAVRERNMQIHLGISLIVIIAGFSFSITAFEWIAIILCIGGMISLEMMNTALERTVDMFTKEFHPLAKQAKDIAAGAVLVFAIASVAIGMIIFIPRISAWFG